MVRSVGYALIATVALASIAAHGDDYRGHSERQAKYEVTITNLTRAQSFTPQLLAVHNYTVALFQPAEAADLPLEILAEGGNTGPLTETLLAQGSAVSSVQTVDGLLNPGQSVTTTVEANRRHRYLSFAAMLIPTNDAFGALNRVTLPRFGTRSYTVVAYDAGTEANDQNCLSIPGPRCGGEGHSPGPNVGDEGFVHVSNGFHQMPSEEGEVLSPAPYDWRNPVARVVVKRIR